MAKKTKTWKIGEYAKGGVITVEVQGKVITVIGKDWDMSQGTRRGSNQSNAKEFTRIEVNVEQRDADRQLSMFLNDLTTSYYTDKLMEWIESKSELDKRMFW
jgi:hypothetical protein|tara:strand:+ start:1347 stop:1652 length:306 start_codon:yes stop_codon:yes gene_type:complete